MEKWWIVPGIDGYVVDVYGQPSVIVNRYGIFIEPYKGEDLRFVNDTISVSDTDIARVKARKIAWEAGYQAGLYPTSQIIENGCPDELHELSWLEGFTKGQETRQKVLSMP